MRVFVLLLIRGGLGPFRGLDAPFAPTPTVMLPKRRSQAWRTRELFLIHTTFSCVARYEGDVVIVSELRTTLTLQSPHHSDH
jgi:hypothetical protein